MVNKSWGCLKAPQVRLIPIYLIGWSRLTVFCPAMPINKHHRKNDFTTSWNITGVCLKNNDSVTTVRTEPEIWGSFLHSVMLRKYSESGAGYWLAIKTNPNNTRMCQTLTDAKHACRCGTVMHDRKWRENKANIHDENMEQAKTDVGSRLNEHVHSRCVSHWSG